MITATRIANIRSRQPSEAAIERSISQGASNRAEAIRMVHDRLIKAAEAEATRTVWNGSYGPKKGARAIVPYADLTEQQREIIGMGLNANPKREAATMHLAKVWMKERAA